MELQPVVSHLLKLSSAWNPFSVEKNKPKTKQTKNPNRKKLVKVMCMCEHWPEVGQVCSALGVAQGVKAGALWGEKVSSEAVSEAVPAPSARAVPAAREALPAPPGQGTACRSCRVVQLCCPALLRAASCAVPWSCSQTVQLH